MPVGGLIAGGIGLVGSIGSSMIGSSAAKDASAAQVALGQQALTQQTALGQQGLAQLLQMFNTAKGAVQPVIDLGTGAATNALSTLQGLLTPGANQTSTLSQIPGFQFAQDWGQKAVQNIGTTTGLGGNVLKAGADYATGAAQQGFGNIVGYLQNLFSTGLGGATSGANALAGAATGAGASAFSGLNQLGSTIGNTLTGIGNSTASGILGSANALSSGISGGTNSITNSLLLSKLFGGGAGAGGVTSTGGIYGAVGPTSVGGAPLVGA